MYADLGEYQECVRIWNYALGLKIMKETLLSLDTGLSLRSLVQLYLDLALRQAELGGQAGTISCIWIENTCFEKKDCQKFGILSA